MATKTTKGCPQGQVSDGKGGCKPALPAKPNTTTTTKVTETAEEKAERIAKEKEAAKKAEEVRVAGLSKKEFKQEKQGIKRNVKVADLKAGKEGKGGKVATAILTGLASAVGVAEGVKGLLKKEKNGGTIKTKMKTGGTMKTKMKVGGMVNSNKKITVSKTTTKYKGGISKAPKTAIPKAKYGMSMSKMGAGGPTSNDMSTMSANSKRVPKPTTTTGSNKGMIASKKMGGSTKKKGKC